MNTINIGNYIVEKKRIGRGSFSKIYKGWHKDKKHIVAIKKIEIDNIKKLNSNIEREIDVMKKLRHPNILKLYDVIYDYDNNNIYLIIEYCSKGDFNKFLNKRPLKEKYAKKYIKQLADGLKYLLENNIMHRDLKPHNILLTDKNELKLSDFGFARYFEQNSLVETLCGSPMYMAPEIMKYREYTNKSDLWSVGIIMYETLTGRLPFNSKTFYNLLKDIDKKNIVIPPDINLTEDCKHLVYSLLKKNPDKRISWKDFFNHKWFIDNEALNIENNLLTIGLSLTNSVMNNLIDDKNKLNKSFNNLISSENLNKSSSIESDDFKNDYLELSFDDIYSESYKESDNESEHNYSFEKIKVNISNPDRSKPIPINANQNYFSNTEHNSPIFNSLKDGSFVIINTPPKDIVRSDTRYNNSNIIKNMKGYLNSSISLLKDSINYISGNNSI
tara:strand:+ start:732 stop:2063 length:1332 start_codon:yes stop_codon:yes gene_type:complete